MIKKIETFSFFLILIFPILIITGPALPDISITLIGLFFLYTFIVRNQLAAIYNHKWVLTSIFFWIFLLLISLFSENKYLAYRDAIIFIRILIIPIFIYFWILTDENNIKKLIFVIFVSVIFVCLDSLYQFSNYDSINGFGKDIFGYKPDFAIYNRLTGPFRDLVPGSYIAKFSLIGLAYIFLFIKNNNLRNISSIIYLTLAGIVIYVSGERMALAPFLLGICLLVIFFKTKRLVFFVALIVIIISCILINKTHPSYNDYNIIESTPYELGLKVEKNYKCNDINNNNCKKIVHLQPLFSEVLKNFKQTAWGEIYLLSLKMWKDHPLNGIGLNNFTYLCKNDQRYKNLLKNVGCVTHPHNYYLQWLVETGLIGLLLFLCYVFFIFKFIIKKIDNPLSILSLIILIILFWPIMSTGSLLKNQMGVSFFYIIGICLSLSRIKQKI